MQSFTSALQSLQGFFLTKRLPSTHPPLQLSASPTPLLLPTVQSATMTANPSLLKNIDEDKQQFTSLSPRSTMFVGVTPSELLTKQTLPAVMYVTKETPLLTVARKSYDSCLKKLHYGDAVTVVAFKGSYAKIQKGKDVGWLEKDVLQNRKENVWPVFSIGSWYSHDHEMTERTRQLIQDNFFAGGAFLPLQPAEYITVELLKDNRRINWSQAVDRVPGRWHQMLRGVLGVHITIHPTTESVMEWKNEDEVGRLAYVREVKPDNTLRIEGFGILEEGIFESVTLPEALWREWRPVFIEVV